MSAARNDERWFQSRLSRPNANLTVLAGTDFANRIVAVFETAEEAKEAVDAHNARLNANGPAEAATSPSRGSNNPYQENAVNDSTDTTAPAVAPDIEKAFDALEGPIAENAGRAKAVDWLVGHMMDRPQNEIGARSIPDGAMEALYYLVSDLRTGMNALDAQWQELA